jgi:sugar lactone lactonase YvrE
MATESTYKTEVIAEGFQYLEGPRWRDGQLWMSDMFGCKVHTVSVDGTVETVVEVPTQPSGLGFLPDGTPLIVSMKDRSLLRLENGKLIPHAELWPLVTGDLNDMVVDAHGRAYVGNLGFDLFGGAAYQNTNFVMVGPAGETQVVVEEVEFPNGTVILPGGNILVMAETWAHRLTAFDINSDGTLSNRRVFADLGEYGPDGICLDQEGGIWISAFNHCAYLRVLEGGTITDRIDMGERHAVACQLGGDDGRTLFCLTAEGNLSDVSAGRSHARVEVTTVDVPGAGSP